MKLLASPLLSLAAVIVPVMLMQISYSLLVYKSHHEAAAIELAKLIASKSPVAVLGTKHLLLHARDHGVQENLNYTQAWNSAMLQTDVSYITHVARAEVLILYYASRISDWNHKGLETSNWGVQNEKITQV